MTTASIMIRCAIYVVLFSTLTSCSTQTPTDATVTDAGTEETHNHDNYEPQAGDRVRLTGVFKTTKGYMGVVKGVLLPHFLNRDEEALKYKGKWVEVIGTLSKRTYPEGKLVQRWLGLELDMESIEIVTADNVTQEKVEKLSPNVQDVR